MKNFRGLILAAAVCGMVSPLMAGSPAVQPVDGGLIPPANASGVTAPDVAGLQTTPQQITAGAPGTGSSYFGTNNTGTPGARERGVAGSGLPREKITEVDAKKLSSSKTDAKFTGSVLDAGLNKASGNEKSQDKANVAVPREGKENKSTSTQSTGKPSADSTKTISTNKTGENR